MPDNTGDCVECNIFEQGICLHEFQVFDTCFDEADAAGRDAKKECMAKAPAPRAQHPEISQASLMHAGQPNQAVPFCNSGQRA
ncbi:hypothetical protein HaLaN_09425 [Haematococcus lacustris]|uniref:Uncharacterized protein n=1 Tax=Haematococcus lacustris TaxID=44745 RepID=A0A699YWE2_HAELA|nr:hypothetical protein HaLaN_09425 [Haematococcus lacustris]